MQDRLHHGVGIGSDTRGPIEQARGIPALDGLVSRGHVGIDGGVSAPGLAADMTGDAGAAVKQLDGAGRQPGIDLLPGKAVGHRVVMAHEFNVIVDAHLEQLPFSKLVTRGR